MKADATPVRVVNRCRPQVIHIDDHGRTEEQKDLPSLFPESEPRHQTWNEKVKHDMKERTGQFYTPGSVQELPGPGNSLTGLCPPDGSVQVLGESSASQDEADRRQYVASQYRQNGVTYGFISKVVEHVVVE